MPQVLPESKNRGILLSLQNEAALKLTGAQSRWPYSDCSTSNSKYSMRSWRVNDQKYGQRGNRGRGSFLNGPSPTLKRRNNLVRFVHRWRPIGQCMAPEPKRSNGMPMKNHSIPLRGSHARVWGGSGTISLPRATIWPLWIPLQCSLLISRFYLLYQPYSGL